MDRARASPKFKPIVVDEIVPYPDGTAGFYVRGLEYVDNISAIFAAERELRRELVRESVLFDGEPLIVAHSVFDGGSAQNIFDGDPFTLARGLEAKSAGA